MMDYQKARTNMVDGQIHTDGVIVPEILEAFETVPRELYVPEEYIKLACNDEDMPIGYDRFLLEPATHAKMLQALELKESDVVLEIGGGSGYGAAILSGLVSTIISVENQDELIAKAAQLWQAQDLCNIVSFKGELKDGHAKNAPYDSIIINGSVAEMPQDILDQLAVNGRLVCIIRKPEQSIGQATLFQKNAEGLISSYPLFDAGSPYLEGFEPVTEFHF